MRVTNFQKKRKFQKNKSVRSLEPELKTVDNLEFQSFDVLAQFYPLNNIWRGTRSNRRVGSKIALKTLTIDWSLETKIPTIPEQPLFNHENLRVLVVLDRQSNNGGAPLYSDIISSYTWSDENPQYRGIWDHANPMNKERFKILYDWRWSASPTFLPPQEANLPVFTRGAMQSQSNLVHFHHIFKDKEMTHYTLDNFNVQDIGSGALWLIPLSTVSATLSAYRLRWNARLRYQDA